MHPLKPDACIVSGKIGVFIGADYKFLTLLQTKALVAKLQRLCATLGGTGKRIQAPASNVERREFRGKA